MLFGQDVTLKVKCNIGDEVKQILSRQVATALRSFFNNVIPPKTVYAKPSLGIVSREFCLLIGVASTLGNGWASQFGSDCEHGQLINCPLMSDVLVVVGMKWAEKLCRSALSSTCFMTPINA